MAPVSLPGEFLENPMDRGAWWATVHRVTKSRAQLKRFSTQNDYNLNHYSKRKVGHFLC